ncbi:hypothetical protein ACVWZ8_004375 [Arthrobacter sp. UYCu723]
MGPEESSQAVNGIFVLVLAVTIIIGFQIIPAINHDRNNR